MELTCRPDERSAVIGKRPVGRTCDRRGACAEASLPAAARRCVPPYPTDGRCMTTSSKTDQPRSVIGGIDTHKDVHVAAVLDELGRLLSTASFPTTKRLSAAASVALRAWRGARGRCRGHRFVGAGVSRLRRARSERDRGEPTEPSDPAAQRQVRHRRCRSRSACGACRRRDRHTEYGGRAGGGVTSAMSGPRRRNESANGSREPVAQLDRHRTRRVAEQLPALSCARSHDCHRWRPGTTHAPRAVTSGRAGAVARRWRPLDHRDPRPEPDINAILGRLAAPLLAVHGVGPTPPASCSSPPATTPTGCARTSLRRALRRRHPRLVRQDQPAPTQPRR